MSIAEQELQPTEGNHVGSVYREQVTVIDWLRIRFVDCAETWALLRSCFPRGWIERPIGFRGWYDYSANLPGKGIIAWNDPGPKAAREGVLLDLSGGALDFVEWDTCVRLMRWALEHDGRITRIDIAWDDKEGRLTYDRVRHSYENKEFVAASRKRGYIETWESEDRMGWTFTFGSRKSNAFIRVYNKEVESGTVGHWVRCEIEYKRELGNAIGKLLVDGDTAGVVADFKSRLRFVDVAGDDSNIRRCGLAVWWETFISAITADRVTTEKGSAQGSLERMTDWVARQVAPTLAAILMANHGDLGAIERILFEGRDRLHERHWWAIEDWWARGRGAVYVQAALS